MLRKSRRFCASLSPYKQVRTTTKRVQNYNGRKAAKVLKKFTHCFRRKYGDMAAKLLPVVWGEVSELVSSGLLFSPSILTGFTALCHTLISSVFLSSVYCRVLNTFRIDAFSGSR